MAESRNANAGRSVVTFKSARSLVVAAGLCLVPALAAAQQPVPLLLLLSADPHAPLSIEAKRLSVLDGQNAAVFEGDVQVKGPNLTLQCSKLLVSYAPDDRTLMYLRCQP